MNSILTVDIVLMCDDVREEMSGKTTLVGIYNDSIFVNKLPTIMPAMCFWMVFRNVEQLDRGVRITIDSPSNRRLATWDLPKPTADVELDLSIPVNLSWKVSPIRFDESGLHTVTGKLGDEASEPIVIYSFDVKESESQPTN